MIADKTVVCATAGFYKVPINSDDNVIYQVNVRITDISGGILQTHYIIAEDTCPTDIPIKWLCKEGFYKFGSFGRYNAHNRSVGTTLVVPKYFTAFFDTDTREEVISKELQENIVLNKRQVPTAVLEYYLDLASSPKIYMYLADKWVQAQVVWNPVYSEKNNFHNIVVEFLLPKSYIQNL